MNSSLHHTLIKVILAAICLIFNTLAEAKIYYVNASATGTTDGSSWTNAYNRLQDAIDIVLTDDTICVAEGEYFPTHLFGSDSLRSVTFYINKAIKIYGGFSGVPGTEANFDSRDPKAHETILSGDIGFKDDHTDNAFHVLYFDHVNDATRLDGFTIKNGNTTNAPGLDAYGAGIFNNALAGTSSPTIAYCIIRDNIAVESGGGMFNFAQEHGESKPTILHCEFINNIASAGGGVGNYTDDNGVVNPYFINSSFIGNSAPTAQGGAMSFIAHSATASPKLINCIITGNDSPTSAAIQCFSTGTGLLCPELFNTAISGNTGGSIRVTDLGTQISRIIIRNSIIWNNTGGHGINTNAVQPEIEFSIIQSGFAGEGNKSEDPMFVSTPPVDGAHTLGDLHLLDISPAIDAGDNSDVPENIFTDLDNQPRFVNPTNGATGTVDIGPYEVQSVTTGISDILPDDAVKFFPNPAKEYLEIVIADEIKTGDLQLINNNGVLLNTIPMEQGINRHSISLKSLPSGMYYLHLSINGKHAAKKFFLE